jgi:hypothetical protein
MLPLWRLNLVSWSYPCTGTLDLCWNTAVSLLQAFCHLERNENVMNTCYTTSLSGSDRRIRRCCEAAKSHACAWKSLLLLCSVSPPFHHYLPREKYSQILFGQIRIFTWSVKSSWVMSLVNVELASDFSVSVCVSIIRGWCVECCAPCCLSQPEPQWGSSPAWTDKTMYIYLCNIWTQHSSHQPLTTETETETVSEKSHTNSTLMWLIMEEDFTVCFHCEHLKSYTFFTLSLGYIYTKPAPVIMYVQNTWDTSVSKTVGHGLDDQSAVLSRGKGFFSSSQCPGQLWGHPFSYPVGAGVFFLGWGETESTWYISH